MLPLLIILLHFFGVSYCLFEVQSIEIVSCTNKQICHDGKNLQIVVKGSTIETTDGSGSISGVVTGGQEWTDSYGDWELLESLNIEINYENATWEYQLEDQGEFYTKAEFNCGQQYPPCNLQTNYVECINRGDAGLYLFDVQPCTKYSINNVESWDASVSIESTHLSLSWSASNVQHSIWNSNTEIYLESFFDTSSCYKDLSDQYNVVVPVGGYQEYYFTSTEYWQDARNNFNMSVETWKRDFDCDYSWGNWHTIIPFYETDAEYFAQGMIRALLVNEQTTAWFRGYFPAYYVQIMDVLTGDCTDMTTYADLVLEYKGAPTDNTYRVAKNGIVDHFQMTLDLDYTQFVQMPTHSPTQQPTVHPSNNPTQTPSINPTLSPTNDPIPSPTHNPSSSPTAPPFDYFLAYEIPAKLEISSASFINISSPQTRHNIINSIASGLSLDTAYIRLDLADSVSISRRRLQSYTENLLLHFTIFTLTESDHAIYITKLEDTSVYHYILSKLASHFPSIVNIFIANVVNECDIGTKPVTIAGDRRCQSICGLNQYFDTSSNSCKQQVDNMATIRTVIKINYFERFLYFGIGVGLWILTLCIFYGIYKCYQRMMNHQNGSSNQERSNKYKKKSVQRTAHSIASSTDNSEYTDGEFESIATKFRKSVTDIKSKIESGKRKLSQSKISLKHKNKKKIIDNSDDDEPLLEDDNESSSASGDSSSPDESQSSYSGSETATSTSDDSSD